MALSVTLQDPTSDKAKRAKIELPAEVFDVPANVALIHQVVVAQLAAARQGTASTKTRGEVRGGGTKPYRQKGTGRARQGSIRAPQFAGGGIVHGPKPRSYVQRTPKKMKAAALRGALSDRARNGRVHVVSAFVDGDTPSTKSALAALSKITEAVHVLVVAQRADALTWKSLRNIPAVHLLEPGQLNTYDVLISDDVVFTQDALESFLGGTPATTAAEPEAVAEPEAAADEVVVEKKAERAAPKHAAPDEAEAPFGPDSHAALENGEQPEGFPIKGNATSKLYHVPGSPFYNRTVAEVWFRSAEAAEAAGFQLPPSQRKKADSSAPAEGEDAD